MKDKSWKVQVPQKDYKYLQLGYKGNNHIVFEINPKNELDIIVGRDDFSICRIKAGDKGKKLLKEWINQNIIKD